MNRSRLVAAAALLFSAISLSARVISYSPYTNRAALPALQHRMNRHFVLAETAFQQQVFLGAPILAYPTGQLVLYDSQGVEEPAVILPRQGDTAITTVAVRESGTATAVLVQTMADADGSATNPSKQLQWLMSGDGGRTWTRVALPNTVVYSAAAWSIDVGGPFARSRYSPVRVGTAAYPFVVATQQTNTMTPVYYLYAVAADGAVKTLATSETRLTLAGSDISGARFLVRTGTKLSIVDLNGTQTPLADVDANSYIEGWITPDGDAYLDERSYPTISISRIHNSTRTTIATKSDPANVVASLQAFAVPTSDYSGAWVVERGNGKPTILALHGSAGLNEQWQDITAPEVEAIHAAPSGKTLLVQVHRSRPQDNRLFLDPALAFWHVGEPAPKFYDELFMNEQGSKGFVHLDVEKAEAGEPFVFDSGTVANSPITVSPNVPSAGGGDVVQEWGVVRASIKQRLVLPGISRIYGAYGSFWQTDVIFHNPLDTDQDVVVRYVPTGEVTIASQVVYETKLTLKPHEIRLVADALKQLFKLELGGGAFFITPDAAIEVTSRTYTRAAKGTYGFGMNGIDVFAATASPRFPVTFSGAFPGANFRTNMILTDVSGRGAETATKAVGFLGPMGSDDLSLSVGPSGQRQYNVVSSLLGLSAADTGALVVQPKRGETIASVVAIDNRTNDATYFPPDLPSPIVRTIPAIGHTEGTNGAQYRSDLYLYNPAGVPRNVILQWRMWDSNETGTINFTMLANEARVIPDVLQRLFGKTGIARLRYMSSGDSSGVRVTSRTYAVDEQGGTYGFLMPPLNNFQSAGSGEALEILGVVGGKDYRTNIGLVELNNSPQQQTASARIEIIDQDGKTIDTFTVNVPSAGGMQLNDVFHARNLGDGPVAALIRVSPLSGIIGAYATLNDNGTNDPTYLAANLAARQP